jgi:hypothetical protein
MSLFLKILGHFALKLIMAQIEQELFLKKNVNNVTECHCDNSQSKQFMNSPNN